MQLKAWQIVHITVANHVPDGPILKVYSIDVAAFCERNREAIAPDPNGYELKTIILKGQEYVDTCDPFAFPLDIQLDRNDLTNLYIDLGLPRGVTNQQV